MLKQNPEQAVPKRQSNRGNSLRHGYELAPQKDYTLLAVVAGVVAGLLHLLLIFCAPYVLKVSEKHQVEKKDVKDEIARVFVKPQEEEIVETTPTDPPEELPEPEEIVYEPVEIDILDADMEELDMAPGQTEIAVPKPVITEESLAADAESVMKPTELDASAFHTEPILPQELAVAEPSPINTNDVIANVDIPKVDVDEAQDTVERELRESAAQEGKEGMPSDTRSLAELMGEADPGSQSGVARIGTDVLFGFNESKLRNSARISMLQLAALIQKNPQTYFLIEGHTDGTGKPEYNDLLGLLRAAAVREWLENNNIPVQYVYIRSCGASKPLVDVTLPKEEQELNRRVEIHMRKGGEEMPEGAVGSSYKVDMRTSVSAQLARGERAPKTAARALDVPKKAEMPDFRAEQGEAAIPTAVFEEPKTETKVPAKPSQQTKPANSAPKPASKTGDAALKRLQSGKGTGSGKQKSKSGSKPAASGSGKKAKPNGKKR